MKGFFLPEEAKHLTDEEYLHYWGAGLAPPPTIEVFARWLDMIHTQLDETISKEVRELEDKLADAEEEIARLEAENG